MAAPKLPPSKTYMVVAPSQAFLPQLRPDYKLLGGCRETPEVWIPNVLAESLSCFLSRKNASGKARTGLQGRY